MPRQPKNPSYNHALATVIHHLYKCCCLTCSEMKRDPEEHDTWVFTVSDDNGDFVVSVGDDLTVDGVDHLPSKLIADLDDEVAQIHIFEPAEAYLQSIQPAA